MRLIKTDTYEMVEFIEPPDKYIILSHTWGRNEISYQEFISGNVRGKQGWTKVRNSCLIARGLHPHGRDDLGGWPLKTYDYIWIDTCCIDKSSSAELTEAINSMYQWYQAADVCIAYLSDLQPMQPYVCGVLSDLELAHRLEQCRWYYSLSRFSLSAFALYIDQSMCLMTYQASTLNFATLYLLQHRTSTNLRCDL